MFQKRWSYRKVTVAVAAALLAFGTLMSIGLVQAQVAFAGRPCVVMPDGTCKPAETGGIELPPIDGAPGLDAEYARQISLDMPIGTSGTPEHPIVVVDRKQVHFDVLPWINPETNRTLVPVRFVSEALGAEVTWTEERPDEVLIERPGLRVFFRIGDDKADANGETVYMDQPSVLVNDRTLVPLRFVAEAFGCTVDWVGADGPNDPRAHPWTGGKYQIWIWAPWLYWGGWGLGDRWEMGNWNLH